jgi:hypothetical protein
MDFTIINKTDESCGLQLWGSQLAQKQPTFYYIKIYIYGMLHEISVPKYIMFNIIYLVQVLCNNI